MVSRQGVVILDYEETSSRARQRQMGNLVRVYMEEELANSLVLYLVDRDNLEAMKKEWTLALSGMVDEDTIPEIGNLSGSSYLIHGEVLEEAGSFKVVTRMTDIGTGKVLSTGSFLVPDSEMVKAADNLRYEYVAKNGIGLYAAPIYYILPPEDYNKMPLVLFDIGVKYRLSRRFMLSAGIMRGMYSTGEYYRWDEGYGDYTDRPWDYFQPGIADVSIPNDTSSTGQVTNRMTGGIFPHIDLQYTLNISPAFNIGFKAGIFSGMDITTAYRISSTGGLYYQETVIDELGGSEPIIKRDYQDVELIFGGFGGARVEVAPEYFITPRMALNLTLGYSLSTKAKLWGAKATAADWEFTDMALESGSNLGSEETYLGFDPHIKPDGTDWYYELSGLYGGLAFSVFF